MFQSFINFFKPAPAHAVIEDQAEIAKQYKKWQIRAFAWAYVGYVAYYLTRQSLHPVAHVFKHATGLSDNQFGLLVSFSVMSYGIAKFLGGIWADKSNIRSLLAFGLLVSSVINLFFSYLPSFILLIFFWTLSQLFQTLGSAACTRVLVGWFLPKDRSQLWLWWDSAQGVGTLLVSLVASVVLLGSERYTWITWHGVFIISGVLGILTAIGILTSMADTPASVGLPPIETYLQHAETEHKEAEAESYWAVLYGRVLRNKYIWILGLGNMCAYFGKYVTLAWLAIFLDSRELGQATIPLIFTVGPLFSAVGAILAGQISYQFFRGRCLPVVMLYFLLFSLVAGIFYFIAGPQHIVLTCVCIAILGLCDSGKNGLMAVTVSFLTD